MLTAANKGQITGLNEVVNSWKFWSSLILQTCLRGVYSLIEPPIVLEPKFLKPSAPCILVGSNLQLIGGILTINYKYVEYRLSSSSKVLKLSFDNPCRVISHWLLTRARSFLGPSKMTAVEIVWLHFLNNRSSIQSFFEVSVSSTPT